MRKLKLKIKENFSTERKKEFDRLVAISKTKHLTQEEEEKLLEEIRSGSDEPIERLVDSWEVNILSIAKQIPTEIPIEELIVVGRNELIKLAKQEVNSPIRERYFRFGAWCVRQGMLKLIISDG